LSSTSVESATFSRENLGKKRKKTKKEIEEARLRAENSPTVLRLRELVAKGEAELRERGGPFR
jgi:hypothetical protein